VALVQEVLTCATAPQKRVELNKKVPEGEHVAFCNNWFQRAMALRLLSYDAAARGQAVFGTREMSYWSTLNKNEAKLREFCLGLWIERGAFWEGFAILVRQGRFCPLNLETFSCIC
jgi:hypothetical protein